MNSISETMKQFKENEKANKTKNGAFDIEKGINDLIGTDFSASDEAKGKAASLLKGLFFSDDPKAVELIEKMDKWFSSLKPT